MSTNFFLTIVSSFNVISSNSYLAIGFPPPEWMADFNGPIPVVADEVYWKVSSTTHKINGYQASFGMNNTAIIDSGIFFSTPFLHDQMVDLQKPTATSAILLTKMTVDQFYSLIPRQYTAKSGSNGVLWYINRATPINLIPKLSIALGEYFLEIDPAVIIDADQDCDPNLSLVPGKLQSREISGLSYDILGTVRYNILDGGTSC